MSTRQLPTVSVVIAAFSSERWDYLQDAVNSVHAQTVPVLETVVVIDHNPELLARAQRDLEGTTVVANAGSRGASGSRNTGVALCRAEIVAFLDDDACAEKDWLEALLPHFANEGVVGVGGRVDPLWATSRPRWFPPEFDWAVGASYPGMPSTAQPIRNVWSNNMAIRRSSFDAVSGFRQDFGKVGQRSRPEDTDLCLRAAEASNSSWIYEPDGGAGHWVPAAARHARLLRPPLLQRGNGQGRPGAPERDGPEHHHGTGLRAARAAARDRARPAGSGRRETVGRPAERGHRVRVLHHRGRIRRRPGTSPGMVRLARAGSPVSGRKPPFPSCYSL